TPGLPGNTAGRAPPRPARNNLRAGWLPPGPVRGGPRQSCRLYRVRHAPAFEAPVAPDAGPALRTPRTSLSGPANSGTAHRPAMHATWPGTPDGARGPDDAPPPWVPDRPAGTSPAPESDGEIAGTGHAAQGTASRAGWPSPDVSASGCGRSSPAAPGSESLRDSPARTAEPP